MGRPTKYVEGFKQGYITLVDLVDPPVTNKWNAICDCSRHFQLYVSSLSDPLKVSCGECELKREETNLVYVDEAGYLITGETLNKVIGTVPKRNRERVKQVLSDSVQLWKDVE